MDEETPHSRDSRGDRKPVFTMDPEAMVWQLARILVDGQANLAKMNPWADEVRKTIDQAPAEIVQQHIVDYMYYERDWYIEALPRIATSLKVALEAYDTYGPGIICIDDPVEVEIWNNKYHVWFADLSIPALADDT